MSKHFFKACRTKQWIKEAHQYKDLYAGWGTISLLQKFIYKIFVDRRLGVGGGGMGWGEGGQGLQRPIKIQLSNSSSLSISWCSWFELFMQELTFLWFAMLPLWKPIWSCHIWANHLLNSLLTFPTFNLSLCPWDPNFSVPLKSVVYNTSRVRYNYWPMSSCYWWCMTRPHLLPGQPQFHQTVLTPTKGPVGYWKTVLNTYYIVY